MIGSAGSRETDKEKQRRKLALQKKYGIRITIAKQGREAFTQKDFLNATKKYNEYLSILAEKNDVEDIFALTPSMFDNKKDVTEMLLISHIYWEIARINELTPKLQKNFHKALHQFVKFTINQPYQVFNAEMLRKYIKKSKGSPSTPKLNETYQQIFVQSKKCFIATMCFGDQHIYTQDLRRVKRWLVQFSLGRKFTELYYRVSGPLTDWCENHHFTRNIFIILSKLPLTFLAKTSRLSIFK